MVKTLKKHTKQYLPDDLLKHLEKYPYVFNPSMVYYMDSFLMTIRVYDTDSKTIQAHLYSWKEDQPYTFVNLTEYFINVLTAQKVADPKLFIMNDEVWGTFNTGYVAKGENQVVLFQIKNTEVKNYFYCHYSERTRIEKNWAFFMKDDCIYALYGIDQVKILKATSLDIIKGNTLNFDAFSTVEKKKYQEYTIGTPLMTLTDTTYGFIGHKKIIFRGKRLYSGRAFIFSPFTETPLKISSRPLIHSYKSLAGNSFKFNKNLISCTYFSGITMYMNEVIISYGINDVDWNMVSIKQDKLWA
ncbi:hypothetical protein [uncultured Dokdonia sp.]|uniref:hypothetical protein n=1 Tax=uncultured Dokdonia sp. TaxID=575653 RepID=UPI0026080A36|nr:hypothetical protein [uncultured Dokdonia sp.]